MNDDFYFDDDIEQPKEEKNTKKPRAARGTGKEAKKTEEKLQNFTKEKLDWIDEQLIILFSSGVTHKELRSIAEVVALHVPGLKKIEREEQRDKRVLKKWYYDNWDKIGDFLKNCVKAYDADNNVVDGNAEKLYYKSRKNKKSS